MTDYISREEAINAMCHLCSDNMRGKCAMADICDLVCRLEAIPAADARPVVLCRDCKHRDPEDHKCDCGQLERAGCVFPVDDDYFCAHGEKMEES